MLSVSQRIITSSAKSAVHLSREIPKQVRDDMF